MQTILANNLEVLIFRLGSEEYGVDIQRVQELRGYSAVTAIANAPASVKGVLNLRGLIVPIIDLRIKLNLGEPAYNELTVVVILCVGENRVGVVVDSVSDVVPLDKSDIKPVPAIAGTGADYLVGMGALDERMIILVDIDKLLAGSDVVEAAALAA